MFRALVALRRGQRLGRFDVLDVDGPAGEAVIAALAATYGLVSSGPLVRTGGSGWHFYLRLTGLSSAARHPGAPRAGWVGAAL